MSDLLYTIFGICPAPSHKNVIPGGEGWYRFDGNYWSIWKYRYANFDDAARYLTDDDLAKFARKALEVLRG